MLSKEDKKEIKRLKQEKKYDEIYFKYGRDVYLNNVSIIHRMQDIKNLVKEGRFFDLQEKYGDGTFNLYSSKCLKRDVVDNTGDKFKAFAIVKSRQAKYSLKYISKVLVYSLAIIIGSIPSVSTKLSSEIQLEYKEEIDEYNKLLNDYVSGLNLEGLSDFEIIMKVVDDMWNSIEGYKNPEISAFDYYRLDIMNGYGVCRNMADDITAKLNAINPEYNARNLLVYSDFGDWTPANINLRNLNEPGSENAVEPSILDKIYEEYIWGNHMVTLVDLKDENITLVIDSTNAGIGVLKNGKIEMFNSQNEIFRFIGISNYLFNDYEENFNLGLYELDSFTNFDNIEKLNGEYGVEAQNKALEFTRSR